jgi:microcystin-dependent protein
MMKKKFHAFRIGLVMAALAVVGTPMIAEAQEIGELRAFAGAVCPSLWTAADGSLFTTAEMPELFAVIGNSYGGDGILEFAVPDLRGRVMVGMGEGEGLSSYPLGDTGGTESVSLVKEKVPEPSVGEKKTERTIEVVSDAEPDDATGDDQKHENRPPYIAVTMCIYTAEPGSRVCCQRGARNFFTTRRECRRVGGRVVPNNQCT